MPMMYDQCSLTKKKNVNFTLISSQSFERSISVEVLSSVCLSMRSLSLLSVLIESERLDSQWQLNLPECHQQSMCERENQSRRKKLSMLIILNSRLKVLLITFGSFSTLRSPRRRRKSEQLDQNNLIIIAEDVQLPDSKSMVHARCRNELNRILTVVCYLSSLVDSRSDT